MKPLQLILAAWFLMCGTANAAGFDRVTVTDSSAAPLEVGIWYPSDTPPVQTKFGPFEMTIAPGAPIAGESLPLVVMSHGSGGTYLGHFDTAIALAEAGYIVAAVMHRGDNYADDSRTTHIMDRPAHVRRVLDHLLAEWTAHAKLDSNRIGMFGFSAGGFTTLVLIGGKPNFSRIAPFCRDHEGHFTCKLLARHAEQVRSGTTENASAGPVSTRGVNPDKSGSIANAANVELASLRDPRIKAAVVAAPALGFTFSPHGLDDVTVPVELWRAAEDKVLPFPSYAEAVRLSLPTPPSSHVEQNAGHFDFLAPCSEAMRAIAAEICTSAEGFERAAFHDRFNASTVRFFDTALKR